MAWDDILNDSNFQKEPEDVKIKVAESYFDQNIGSNDDYQAETPEVQSTVRNNFMATVRPEVPDTGLGAVRPERTIGGTLRDVPVTLAKGVAGLYGAAVGLADIPTFGYAGKLLEDAGIAPEAAQKYLSTFLSPAQQAASKEVAEAEGFLPTLEAAIRNPSVIAQTIGESIPSIIGGGLIARGAVKAIPKLAKYATGIGEGTIMTGAAAEQLRAESETGLLGVGDIAASLALGTVGGAIGIAGSKVANKLGFADIDALAAGVDVAEGGVGLVKRVIGGGITEGLFEELPQSAQETIFMNAAQDRPLLEGVGESAAMGLLAGVAMGSAANVFPGLTDTPEGMEKAGTPEIQSLPKEVAEKIVADQTIHPRTAKEIATFFNEVMPKDARQSATWMNELLEEAGVGLNSFDMEAVKTRIARGEIIGGEVIEPKEVSVDRLDLALKTQPALRTAEDRLEINNAMNQDVDIEIASVFTGRTLSETANAVKAGEPLNNRAEELIAEQLIAGKTAEEIAGVLAPELEVPVIPGKSAEESALVMEQLLADAEADPVVAISKDIKAKAERMFAAMEEPSDPVAAQAKAMLQEEVAKISPVEEKIAPVIEALSQEGLEAEAVAGEVVAPKAEVVPPVTEKVPVSVAPVEEAAPSVEEVVQPKEEVIVVKPEPAKAPVKPKVVKKPKVITVPAARKKVEAGGFDAIIEEKGWAPGSVKVALNRAEKGKILAPIQQEIVDALTGKVPIVAPKVEEKVAEPKVKKKVLTAKTATKENLVPGAQFKLPGIEQSKNIYEVIKVDGDYLEVKGVAGAVEGEIETFTRGDITGEDIAFKREEKIEDRLPVGKIKGKPSKADVVATVDIITRGWVEKPKTKFVSGVDKLPENIKAKIDTVSEKARATKIPAFYDPSSETVYFLSDNLDSYDGVLEAVAHEMFGHYGLRKTLGKRIGPILNQTYIKHREAAQAVAIDYGFDLSTEIGRQRAAEEVLSNLARENKDPGLLKKVYAMIRDFLRSIGLVKTVTDNDLRTMLANASEYVREGDKILAFLGSNIVAVVTGDKGSVKDLKIVFKRDQVPVQDQTEDERRSVDDITGEAKEVVKRFFKRNFTKEGLLNNVAFEQKIDMEAEMNLGESDIELMVKEMNNAIKKAYGKKYAKVPKAELKKVNDYLGGATDIDLPAGLKKSLGEFRSMIDVQSEAMLKTIKDLEGIAREKLTPVEKTALDKAINNEEGGYVPKPIQKWWSLYDTIHDNKGTYLNRSYQAFDDPKWESKVRRKKGVIERAEDFIRAQNPDFTDGEVVGAVGAILQGAKESTSLMSMISKGSKVGSKDVSITKKRKDVPQEIMDLLGVYTDPKINFTRSVAKMQYYVANHNFLMGLRSKGFGNFLFERPTGEFTAKIAGKASDTMSPLNGLHSTPDFNLGMGDALEGFEGSDLMRTIIKANSFLKYGKTILSPTTQARNFISAYMFTVMNGHFNMTHMMKAIQVAKSDIFSHDKKWQAYLDKLKRNGVLHDNPYAGELRDALKDFANSSDLTGDGKLRWLAKMAQKTYQVGDDFWKIIGYENELTGFLKAGLSQDAAEKKAAYRIRNGYPTYSMVPRGIKKIRRWPLIGTFVSFPYEIVRTTRNQLNFIKEDMKDPKTRPMAMKRMLGLALASSASYSASLASMAMMGMDADDDEAIRAQLPEWSRNSQLVYWGYDKDGLPRYLDLSFADPYTYLKKPLTALASGNNKGLDKKIEDGLREFLVPFIGADIGAAAVGELLYNRKATGGEVYNPEDSGFRKANDILQHTRKAVQPGILSNIEKTVGAISGEVSRSGKTYSVGDEAWAWAGFRFGTLNLNQSMNYKGYGFRDRKTKSTRILNTAIGSAATVSDRQINSAVSSMLTARENAYSDMINLVKGSRKLGVKASDIMRSLRASGVSKDDIKALLRGRTPRWTMKKDFLKAATERAMVAAPTVERKRELRIEMRHRRIVVAKALRDEYKKK